MPCWSMLQSSALLQSGAGRGGLGMLVQHGFCSAVQRWQGCVPLTRCSCNPEWTGSALSLFPPVFRILSRFKFHWSTMPTPHHSPRWLKGFNHGRVGSHSTFFGHFQLCFMRRCGVVDVAQCWHALRFRLGSFNSSHAQWLWASPAYLILCCGRLLFETRQMGCPTPKCLGLRRQWPKRKVGCGWSGSGSVGLSRVAWGKDDSQATCQTWVIAMAEVCARPSRPGGWTDRWGRRWGIPRAGAGRRVGIRS